MDYGAMLKCIRGRFGHCYNVASYYTKIGEWLEWYKGFVKSYHTISYSNGITTPSREMFHLNMAKRACEDWVSSVLSEDLSIVVSSSNNKSSIFVQGSKENGGVLGSNNFSTILSDNLEKMFALGTSALALDLDGITVDTNGNIVSGVNATIKIKSYNATRIIPISYDNGIITEVAFVSETNIKGKTYYTVSSHIKEPDGYVIYNDIYNANYQKVNLDIPVLSVIRTKSIKPLFVIMKTNITNNVDLDSPLGVSIYYNAIDTLKGIDQVYDNCVVEVINGRRIIMMNKCLLTCDDQGKPIAPQDMRQSLMQFFGDDADTSINEYIKDFAPSLRSTELDAELQNQLNMFSSLVGFGTKFYNFSMSNGVTATEYAGERQDFVRNSGKMTNMVCVAIKSLISEILWLGQNILGVAVNADAKVTVTAQDNIVEADDKEREQDRQDVRDGIMSKAEYRAKWYGETIEDAQTKINAISSGTAQSAE